MWLVWILATSVVANAGFQMLEKERQREARLKAIQHEICRQVYGYEDETASESERRYRLYRAFAGRCLK